jgi:hypothetical protein
MQDVIRNPFMAMSDAVRYPKIDLKQPETGSVHSTELALIAVALIRDMFSTMKGDPESKGVEIDLPLLTLKALYFDHTIDGYQVGSPTKEVKYYNYEVAHDLGFSVLFDLWAGLKDDSLESRILKLADFLTNIRKCLDEIVTLNNPSMIPVAQQVHELMVYECGRISKAENLLDRVKTYLVDAYGRAMALLDDVLKPAPVASPAPAKGSHT